MNRFHLGACACGRGAGTIVRAMEGEERARSEMRRVTSLSSKPATADPLTRTRESPGKICPLMQRILKTSDEVGQRMDYQECRTSKACNSSSSQAGAHAECRMEPVTSALWHLPRIQLFHNMQASIILFEGYSDIICLPIATQASFSARACKDEHRDARTCGST